MVLSTKKNFFVKNEIYQKRERKREKDRYSPINDIKQQISKVALFEHKSTPCKIWIK
jgi:hypothetical protein